MIIAGCVLYAFDFPVPTGVKKIVYNFSSYSWDNSAGWIELKDIKTITETFNQKGKILTREISHLKNVLIEKTAYSYSGDGYRKTTYNVKNAITRYSEVIRDGSDLVETVYGADAALYAKFVSETDSAGLPQKTEHYDQAGTLVWRIVYEYDEKNNYTSIFNYNPDGSLAFESSFDYQDEDAAGNWTTRIESGSYADVGNRTKDIVRRKIAYAK
jgi:hypothetical protein